MSWAVALFGALVQFGFSAFKWAKGEGFKVSSDSVLVASIFSLWGLLVLPMEWLGVALMAVIGVRSLVPSSQSPKSVRARLGLAAVMFAAAAVMGLMVVNVTRERIILSDSSVSWEGAFEGTVPRQGLRVHATGGTRRWWETRAWYSWTSFSGDALGPSPMGSGLYLGPSGLIRGDGVGRRIAAWAGTEPEHRTINR